jgi:hypothetical protein
MKKRNKRAKVPKKSLKNCLVMKEMFLPSVSVASKNAK